MFDRPATIEFIEKLGELAKNFGALLVRYAQQLQAERQAEAEQAQIARMHMRKNAEWNKSDKKD